MELSDTSRTLAGILLLSLVTIEFGGTFMLRVVLGKQPTTDLQKTFFRAGHAHAGVLVILSLVIQPYVDATDLSGAGEWLARTGAPVAALLIPGGFFLSVARPGADRPSKLIWMLYAGVVVLAAGLVAAGVGLLTA
ncbi:MAG TPA: hypothetical protein VGJ86_12085 [Acidimicrobiales bacterium]|jgi:hypothetical protein